MRIMALHFFYSSGKTGEELDVGSTHIFVLMPFGPSFDATYAAIRTVAGAMRVRVARADEIQSARAVMDDIWSGICNSAVVVADCTGRNPNVFYELGIAHTVGRDVLLTQGFSEVPFDIGHMRHIQYKATVVGLQKLKGQVAQDLDGDSKFRVGCITEPATDLAQSPQLGRRAASQPMSNTWPLLAN